MTKVNSKVRAIVLNTNLWSRRNEQTEGDEDPAQQFSWLQTTLEQATKDGEMVKVLYGQK